MRPWTALAFAVCAAAAPSYRAGIEAWRATREARLRSEHGWLSVAGLFWLKPGRNVLPAPYDKSGWFELDGAKATAHLGATTKVLRDEEDVVAGGVDFEFHASGPRRAIRVRDPANPRRKTFPALRWFPVDEAYRVSARFVPYEPPREVEAQNLAGDVEKTVIPGYAEFRLGGRDLRLEPFIDEGVYLFVFRDATSGKESYPTARFLVAEPPKDGRLELDFNKSYNPPCAFTPFATCPLPPAGNRLKARVAAGEKRGH